MPPRKSTAPKPRGPPRTPPKLRSLKACISFRADQKAALDRLKADHRLSLLCQQAVDLDAVIEAHKKKHHRDGCCYCGSNGCCDVESIIDDALRIEEIIRWPDGTPNLNPALGAKFGRYNCASESDEAFLRRMGIDEVA